MMHSCLYHGRVHHRRWQPAEHAFHYALFLAYLDLDELPMLLQGGFALSRRAFSAASFCRGDHLGDPSTPLADAVRDLAEERTGWRPSGAIRLLTPLRNWGHYFSPLSLYYCFGPDAETVEGIVAEVTNTPWHERHWYVLWHGNRTGQSHELRFHHPKAFHVSPFMRMDLEYQWHLTVPGEQLAVSITSFERQQRLFAAGMALRRRELTRGNMLRLLVRFPWMNARVVEAIHWQALRLWWKGCPYVPHP